MIQFQLDHKYVSDIDSLLKGLASKGKERAAVKTIEKQPIRLLARDELPFSLEKRHSTDTGNTVETEKENS